MNDILNDYIVFILKILTFFFILSFFFIFFNKHKKEKKYSNIKIKNINKDYLNSQITIYEEMKKDKKSIKNLHIESNDKNNLFIINFKDDIYAKDIENIRYIISIIILISNKNDEVLLLLTSSGGFINNYGFAASQFKRLKDNNIKLTISIDLIAASGGYLIASTANKIIASQFAIIGSIGVLAIVPNINKLLEKNNIEIEYYTAGKFKKTLNIFGKNTDQGRIKFINSLNKTHLFFKKFVKENRFILDIEKVSTGEYWYAQEALNLNLIDKIQTSDEFILEKLKNFNIYEISIENDKTLKKKIKEIITHSIKKII